MAPSLWYHARMDKRAHVRSIPQVLLAPPPETTAGVYMVRWYDDESGWRTARILANSAEAAVGFMDDLIGPQPHMEALRVQTA